MFMIICINYTNHFYQQLITFPTHVIHHTQDVWFPSLCSGLRQGKPIQPTLLLFTNIHTDIYFLLQRMFQKTNIWNGSPLWGWCHHVWLQNPLLNLKVKCHLAHLFCTFSSCLIHPCLFLHSCWAFCLVIIFIFISWIRRGLQNPYGYGNSHICLKSQEVKSI